MRKLNPNLVFSLVLLLVLVLSFGLLIPFLGFYWDDWPAVVLARLRPLTEFWGFYAGERPFSAWTYILTMPFLGTSPLSWHITSLLLRWLTILAMWWTLRGLWPKFKREIVWICLIFAVYPVFTQQPIALAFSQHWITYGLFFVSTGAMIQAFRSPKWFWLLTTLAIFTQILHVFTMEYFWGLEFLRPLILWILYSEQRLRLSQRLRKVFINWLPYLLILIAGVIIRMTVYVDLEADPNRPDLLYSLKQPLSALLRIGQLSIQDFINNFFGAWYKTLDPLSINLTDRVFLFSLLVAFLAGGLIFAYLRQMQTSQAGQENDRSTWIKQAVLFGLMATFLGPLPVWLSDRQAVIGLQGGRFALAAMFGLSILLVALLEWFTSKPLPKILLVSALVGLAAGFHIRSATQYYRATLQQNQFYWQLYWRAPYIQPDTAILSNDELFPYVGREATAMTLNILYPQPNDSTDLGYWFLELPHDIGSQRVPRLARDIPLTADFRNFTFTGSGRNSLLVFYKPGTGRCLWVLSSDDFDNSNLPELTLQALPASNLERIVPDPTSEAYPAVDLFGEEPEHDWCFYFQKADLATQLRDWDFVRKLGDEAEALGYEPADANEWLPFIQGYAHSGMWAEAQNRTRRAFKMNPDILPRLCRVWSDILAETNQSADVRAQIEAMLAEIECTQ